MLNIILSVLGLAVLVVIVLALMKPNEFRMQREALINAPAEKIFAILNDFKRWGEFSPWDKKDPAMKRNYGDVTAGKGGYYGWEGNKDVGIGNMTITESTPSSKVVIQLNFVKPFEANNIVEFNLTPQGSATQVVWSMRGPNNFMSKLMQVFMDMDKMVGKDFEAGLASLKASAEK
jgi:hypothetical protein